MKTSTQRLNKAAVKQTKGHRLYILTPQDEDKWPEVIHEYNLFVVGLEALQFNVTQ